MPHIQAQCCNQRRKQVCSSSISIYIKLTNFGVGKQLLGRIAMHSIKCGLLLPTFRGLCAMCLLSRIHTAEPIEDIGCGLGWEQGTMVGARIRHGEGAIWGHLPAHCKA